MASTPTSQTPRPHRPAGDPATAFAILRRRIVESRTGISRTTIYRRIKEGTFTSPVNLGGGIVGWPAHEIEAINQARIAGKSDDEIKVLVAQLHEARTAERECNGLMISDSQQSPVYS